MSAIARSVWRVGRRANKQTAPAPPGFSHCPRTRRRHERRESETRAASRRPGNERAIRARSVCLFIPGEKERKEKKATGGAWRGRSQSVKTGDAISGLTIHSSDLLKRSPPEDGNGGGWGEAKAAGTDTGRGGFTRANRRGMFFFFSFFFLSLFTFFFSFFFFAHLLLGSGSSPLNRGYSLGLLTAVAVQTSSQRVQARVLVGCAGWLAGLQFAGLQFAAVRSSLARSLASPDGHETNSSDYSQRSPVPQLPVAGVGSVPIASAVFLVSHALPWLVYLRSEPR